jgi:hypothetical protein
MRYYNFIYSLAWSSLVLPYLTNIFNYLIKFSRCTTLSQYNSKIKIAALLTGDKITLKI